MDEREHQTIGGRTAHSAARTGAAGVSGPSAPIIDCVEALSREAVVWVAREIAKTIGVAHAGTPPADRYQSESDLAYLIQLLIGSLATTQTLYFSIYMQWLRTALTTRGIASDTIAQSLNLLLAFFQNRLPSQDAQKVENVLRAGLAVLGGPDDSGGPVSPATTSAIDPEVSRLTERLAAVDLPGARAVVTEMAERPRDYLAVTVHLLQPALYAIGERWQRNQLSITDANAAVEICRLLLVELFASSAPRLGTSDRSIVLASVENDRHVIPVQIVAEAFLIAGWKVHYLGASLGTSSLVQAVDRLRPDVVGLSVSLLQQLPTLKLAVGRLKGELGSRCPLVIVGGRPTNEITGIWRWIEADAWSPDAEHVVETVCGAKA